MKSWMHASASDSVKQVRPSALIRRRTPRPSAFIPRLGSLGPPALALQLQRAVPCRAVFLEFLRRDLHGPWSKRGGGLGERAREGAKRSGARKKTAARVALASATLCVGVGDPGRVRFAFAFSRLYIRVGPVPSRATLGTVVGILLACYHRVERDPKCRCPTERRRRSTLRWLSKAALPVRFNLGRQSDFRHSRIFSRQASGMHASSVLISSYMLDFPMDM